MYIKLSRDRKTEIRKYNEYVHKMPVKSFVDRETIYTEDHFHCPRCNKEYKIPFTKVGCNTLNCECGLCMSFSPDLRGDIDKILMECIESEKNELKFADKTICENCGNDGWVTYEDGERRCVVCMDKHKTRVVGKKIALKTDTDEWDGYNEATLKLKTMLDKKEIPPNDLTEALWIDWHSNNEPCPKCGSTTWVRSDLLGSILCKKCLYAYNAAEIERLHKVQEEDFGIIVHNTGVTDLKVLQGPSSEEESSDYECGKGKYVKPKTSVNCEDMLNVDRGEKNSLCHLLVFAFDDNYFSCWEHVQHFGFHNIKDLSKCSHFEATKDGLDCLFHAGITGCSNQIARRECIPKLLNNVSAILKQCGIDK
jgi:hypothetical protein